MATPRTALNETAIETAVWILRRWPRAVEDDEVALEAASAMWTLVSR
jgi:hypothetical protein